MSTPENCERLPLARDRDAGPRGAYSRGYSLFFPSGDSDFMGGSVRNISRSSCTIAPLFFARAPMLHLIANAHVFAPEDLGVRHLLVGSGRFLSVVNDPDDISAPGLTVTDLDGRRLIPGFIDGHAHITGGGGESGFESGPAGAPVDVLPVPASPRSSACSARTIRRAIRARSSRRRARCARRA